MFKNWFRGLDDKRKSRMIHNTNQYKYKGSSDFFVS